ncbi:unnamed protein product [Litomosoides sigmodontis]|uniref:Ig-like domain-containing protein n=1 Tax=Litomosoides sigmodontis TaxID=42156 RepID=A0A3P6V0I2_LITSI|nr:unnamed protein product [Litomosoides sigmodontis]
MTNVIFLEIEKFFVIEDAVFLTRPKAEPYYVTEGQQGPVMECSFAPEFRNRTRYEPSWTLVASDLPRHLTRNGVSFSKQQYALLEAGGAYNLQIRRVVFHRDNGKFFCTVLDKESGTQYTVQANIVVVVPFGEEEVTFMFEEVLDVILLCDVLKAF